MRIDQAKSIRLDFFLEQLGHQPVKLSSGCKWYKSPFRQENTASFKLTRDAMAYYDHAEGKGGNIIDLAQRLGQLQTVSEALVFIENTVASFTMPEYSVGQPRQISNALPAYQLISAQPFQGYMAEPWTLCIRWLCQRAIDSVAIAQYTHRIKYSRYNNTRSTHYAIGVANLAGGYEAREVTEGFRKLSIGPKAISVFRAISPDNRDNTLHIFEGLPDFWTYLTRNCQKSHPISPESENFMILNGTGMIGQATEYLSRHLFRFVAVWSQYGQGGQAMEEQLLTFLRKHNRPAGSTKELYPPPPDCSPEVLKKWDFNAWWMSCNSSKRY